MVFIVGSSLKIPANLSGKPLWFCPFLIVEYRKKDKKKIK